MADLQEEFQDQFNDVVSRLKSQNFFQSDWDIAAFAVFFIFIGQLQSWLSCFNIIYICVYMYHGKLGAHELPPSSRENIHHMNRASAMLVLFWFVQFMHSHWN